MEKGMLLWLVVVASMKVVSEASPIPGSSKLVCFNVTDRNAEGIDGMYYKNEEHMNLFDRKNMSHPLSKCSGSERPERHFCEVCKMEDQVLAWCNFTDSTAPVIIEGYDTTERIPLNFTHCVFPARPLLTTPAAPGHPEEHAGTNLGAVLGAVLGCLALVGIIAAAAICYWQREKLSSFLSEWRRSSHTAVPTSETNGIKMKGSVANGNRPANAE